jgi:hypothetical protein
VGGGKVVTRTYKSEKLLRKQVKNAIKMSKRTLNQKKNYSHKFGVTKYEYDDRRYFDTVNKYITYLYNSIVDDIPKIQSLKNEINETMWKNDDMKETIDTVKKEYQHYDSTKDKILNDGTRMAYVFLAIEYLEKVLFLLGSARSPINQPKIHM